MAYDWYQAVDDKTGRLSKPYGAASFDICPNCKTQYGVDDHSEEHNVTDMWRGLRTEWLDKVGWDADALRQLKENLGLTEEQARRDAGESRKRPRKGS
jgi:hypothetical protein